MSQQTDRTWQYGQTAATLLVAYMLVMQGLAVSFVTGAKLAPGVRFASSICLTNKAPGGKPTGPGRAHSGSDACCVLHCSGLGDGAIAGFLDHTAPVLAYTEIGAAFYDDRGAARYELLSLGARAPPSILA